MGEVRDRSWEEVQKKAFRSWLNETLSHRSANLRVDDLYTELSDGVKLINFFEELSSKPIKTGYDQNPRDRIRKIQNLHIALTFLERDMQVRNPGCSAEDIVDTETKGIKLLLGLLWTLFRKYRISVIREEDKSSEEGLLLWVKKLTEDYPGVEVTNWKHTFRNGLAFLALTHAFAPDTSQVEYANYRKETPEENLLAAFEFAEREVNVPKLLDPKEVMEGKVDERALVLYTTLFFHAYKAKQLKLELEGKIQEGQSRASNERASKEELLKKNTELEEHVIELQRLLEAQKTVSVDLEFKIVQLTEEHTQQLTHFTQEHEVRFQKLEEVQLTLDNDKSKLEREVAELKQLLSQEISVRETRDRELALLTETHAREKAERERLEAELKLKSSEASVQIGELSELKSGFELQVEQLKVEVENFKENLEKEKKEVHDKSKQLDEKKEIDTVQRKGLQVLRRNLEQHIEDIHRWSKYLEYDKKTTFDFDVDVRPQLQEELDQINFVEQLELLSGKLDTENESMLKVLKQKKAEAKAQALSSSKGKGPQAPQ